MFDCEKYEINLKPKTSLPFYICFLYNSFLTFYRNLDYFNGSMYLFPHFYITLKYNLLTSWKNHCLFPLVISIISFQLRYCLRDLKIHLDRRLQKLTQSNLCKDCVMVVWNFVVCQLWRNNSKYLKQETNETLRKSNRNTQINRRHTRGNMGHTMRNGRK